MDRYRRGMLESLKKKLDADPERRDRLDREWLSNRHHMYRLGKADKPRLRDARERAAWEALELGYNAAQAAWKTGAQA